ncbi:alpha/beta family hydrolase [Halomonas huangheensis]|nr:alpha/beta family hydrolase [Halomonas huangheensis]ALM51581.1 dienelactone hydrolase [Halomonas huangheensis]
MANRQWVSISLDDLGDRCRQGMEGCWQVGELGLVTLAGPCTDRTLLMAHGAGAGHDSAFLTAWRSALAIQGIQTLSLEFAYMRQMREEGRRRPPPRVSGLCEEFRRWSDVLSDLIPGELWLGGKSMGGRVASMVAAHSSTPPSVPGLVLVGYPFHPVGKPERLRLDHWPQLRCPTLVLQGERDPFGTREEVEGYTLGESAEVQWLEDGDHDWVPRKASGYTQKQLVEAAAETTGQFILRV